MSNVIPKLSEKYLNFLAYGINDGRTVKVENLEGTTAAGKTTVGVIKFMLKVASMDEKFHIISGKDRDTIQRNVINPDLGIMDIFGETVENKSNGSAKNASSHLIYHTPKGEKIIYLLGYGDSKRWEKVLGGQFGGVYIDEVNTADIDFLDNVMMRNRYMMTTSNPDDPFLPVYDRLINRSRPIDKYKDDVPREIMNELELVKPEPGWTYWFFDFYDNAGLTPERIEEIINNPVKGTKNYKNKILGLRGRAEGLVFPSFAKANILTREEANRRRYVQFTTGVDTSYSQTSDDTMVFIFAGLSTNGEYIVLDEYVMNNRDLNDPLSPSDVAIKLVEFLEKNRKNYGFSRYIHVDSADQATITELNKLKRERNLSYVFKNSDKTMQIIDRINSMNAWIGKSDQLENIYYKVVDECTTHMHELEVYMWNGDKPEDRNDHTVNASQYAWIPHRAKIGIKADPQQEKKNIQALRRKLSML